MVKRRSKRLKECKKSYIETKIDSDEDEEEEIVEKKMKIAENLKECIKDKKKKLMDNKSRIEFLLKKSETFSMFLNERKKKKSKTNKDTDEFSDMEDENNSNNRRIYYFESSPSYIKNGEMRDYQIRGLNWLISLYYNGINGILADEMGLGKTIQSISLLGYMKEYCNNSGPHIIICPKSTLANWIKEFEKWCPSLVVISLNGTKEERKESFKNFIYKGKWDVLITSYEICIKDKSYLNRIYFKYIIIDEAHRIKNEKSKLSEIVRGFKSNNRLLLTGTPLQNNLHELWSLLNFLLPDIFVESDDFDSWFNDDKILDEEKKIIQKLHTILQPFLLRRLKSEVENKLLPKKILKIYVSLTSVQKTLYKQILLKDINILNMTDKKIQRSGLMNILMQLRKCCNHPYLFTSTDLNNSTNSSSNNNEWNYNNEIINNCGKMRVLDKLLIRLKNEGSRVLIFSQMTRLLDILEDYVIYKNYEYCRLDGNTPHHIRTESIEEFNAVNSTKFIFLLSTRAGGLGINLATADIVILYDSDWNPQSDLQAMDRAHRIGQKKQVRVFRFITENTVEERIIHRAELKLRLDNVVIQQGRLIDQQQNKVTDKELYAMIRHDAESIFASTTENIRDEDIDAILEKSETKTAETNEKLQKICNNEDNMKNFSLDNPDFIYNFEGENYQNKKLYQQPLLWIEPPKRERKVNYGVDAYYKDVMNDKTVIKSNNVNSNKVVFKQPQIHDFQFYPLKLKELLNKELLAYKRSINYQVGSTESDEEKYHDNSSKYNELQHEIDNAVPLTSDEIVEKDKLLQEGFNNWSRKEFNQFLRGIEKYGKDDLQSICNDIESKTYDEIVKYSHVFWQRYHELSEYDKIINQLQKAQAKNIKIQETKLFLSNKLSKYDNPYIQLKIHYGTNKGKGYTEDEDRFILCTIHRIGLENDDLYDQLRLAIRLTPMFRFDWFFKSRSSNELQRRANTLLSMIQREMEDSRKNKSNPITTPTIQSVPSKDCGTKSRPKLSSTLNNITTSTSINTTMNTNNSINNVLDTGNNDNAVTT